MKKLIYILLFILGLGNCIAQVEYNYIPITKEKINKELWKKELKSVLNSNIGKIDSKYKKKIEDIYVDKFEDISEAIDSGRYYFDDTLYVYFQNILKNIQEGNQNLNNPDIKLYVSRETYPNAYCMGEGSIVFNIGLLRYLKNESQIAFIICHELAHFSKNHVMKNVEASLNKLYSKETQEELKKIKNSEYGTYTKSLEFAKSYTFDKRKHGRMHEMEADSLGYVLLRNTKYDEREALTTLALLDSTDFEKFRDSLQLDKFFDFNEFPFKKSWIAEEKKFIFSKDTTSKAELDSLKTHPDCKKRIENLSRIFTTSSNKKSIFVQQENLFHKLISYSDFECIYFRLKNKNLDGAFYLTLKMLHKYPKNVFLNKSLDTCFILMKDGLTNHCMNRYLDLPSPFQETDYKIVVRMLNNLRLSEVQTIRELYTKKSTQKY
jgi:Zn-dependent protease with chaperone function